MSWLTFLCLLTKATMSADKVQKGFLAIGDNQKTVNLEDSKSRRQWLQPEDSDYNQKTVVTLKIQWLQPEDSDYNQKTVITTKRQ